MNYLDRQMVKMLKLFQTLNRSFMESLITLEALKIGLLLNFTDSLVMRINFVKIRNITWSHQLTFYF